jgi:hypothetical protein
MALVDIQPGKAAKLNKPISKKVMGEIMRKKAKRNGN